MRRKEVDEVHILIYRCIGIYTTSYSSMGVFERTWWKKSMASVGTGLWKRGMASLYGIFFSRRVYGIVGTG